MQFHRQPVSRNIHRLEKFLPKNLSRMHRPPCLTLILDTHDSPSFFAPSLHLSFSPYSLFVVIRYLNIVGITVPAEHKAHTELIIDPNTVLAFPVVVQLFQSIAGRIRKSSTFTAELSMASFLLATFRRFAGGIPLLLPVSQKSFVPRSAKSLITQIV